jgi:hyperosmotically inducible protein
MRRSLLGLSGAVLLTALAGPVEADESPPRPPASALGLIRDLRLTTLAKRALHADRVLAPLNLSVKVQNGVAELSGTVPSDEVGRQAVAKVETVKGISEVRANFRYQGPAATGATAPARKSEERTVTEVAKPVPPPEVEPPRNRPGGPAIVTGGEGRKARPEKPKPLPLMESTPLPRPNREEAVVVKPPRNFARLSEAGNAETVVRPPTLAERVEQVRRGDARFRAIPVEIEDDVLIVKRGGVRSEDATALSQLLRRIPGVRSVVLSSD